MKTQISRKTFDLKKRYSGVYQQQGRMLTDADWNEKVDIEKLRVSSAIGKLVIGGAPQNSGFIHYNNDYKNPTGELKWGSMLVDGLSADIVPGSGDFNDDFDYLNQQDFPDPPQAVGGVSLYNFPAQNDHEVYLDVWERELNYLEDEELRDPALQGADTCTRTKTMAQIKLCPASIDPEDLLQNPTRGNATLTLHQREGSTSPDTCDPCAREVELENSWENYLFRVEVHEVSYSGQAIDTLVLKWSSENAAEQYESSDIPIGFKQDTYCYEMFGGQNEDFSSEKHSGRHFIETDPDVFPKKGELFFHNAYPAANADKLIRRWDGTITLHRVADDDWEFISGEDRGTTLSDSEKSFNEHAYVYLNGSYPGSYAQDYLGLEADDVSAEPAQQRLIINLNTIVFKLELEGKNFIVGDYWNTAVRNKEIDELQDEALLLAEEPEGIEHHYYRIAHLSSGIINWAESLWERNTDPETLLKHRRLPFASIEHLQANSIAYRPPECQSSSNESVLNLLNEGDNAQWLIKDSREPSVQGLLDGLLCLFNASHLPLDRENAACLITQENEAGYTEAQSVQQALNHLCTDIQSLTAEDIAFELAPCPSVPQKTENLSSLLTSLPVPIEQPETVKNVLMNILCDMDARHIPLYKDAGLCQDLRADNSIISVQDAINSLCSKETNSCVSFTLEPGNNIQSIFDKVKAGQDANFCFQAGYFELEETLLLKNKGSIKITGAGSATKIVVKNNKCALHISSCQEVTIRDLNIESQSLQPFLNGKNNKPTGVVTLSDCPQATIEYLQLKCAAGTRHIGNCLTVMSENGVHSSRIKSCDLTTGDYQTGMLITNASRAFVEDNIIQVAKRPPSLTFERIARDHQTNIHMRHELVDKILIKKSALVEDSKSFNGNVLIKVGDYNVFVKSSIDENAWAKEIQKDPPKADDYNSKEAARRYVKGQIERIVKSPEPDSDFLKRLNAFGKLNEDPSALLSLRQKINLIATSDPVVEDKVDKSRTVSLTLGEFDINFDSVLSTSSWRSMINRQPPEDVKDKQSITNYLVGLQKSLMVDANFRDAISAAKKWFARKKENNPTAGYAGIICAGKKAGDIKIINNNIQGVTEAIRVAISNGGMDVENSSGLQAETVTISNNRMSLSKPATISIAPRAMMVGNCKHLIVENNRMIATGIKAETKFYYEGLRVYGVLGRTIIIRQNSLANCITGITITPLGADKESWQNNLWKVSDNILPGAEETVIPDTVKDHDSNLR